MSGQSVLRRFGGFAGGREGTYEEGGGCGGGGGRGDRSCVILGDWCVLMMENGDGVEW